MYQYSDALTSNTDEQLLCETLNVAVGEWCKLVGFEEVENTHPVKISDDADVVAVVEAISEVNTLIAIELVMILQCLQNP